MFNPQDFFEDYPQKNALHIGLRMVKTVVAIFICGILGFFRGEPPFFAMFAAVICMQNTTEGTLLSAVNRVVGTLIGGTFGVLLRLAGEYFGFYHSDLIYYFFLSVLMFPVMQITLLIKKPSLVQLVCVVFISVSLTLGDVLNGGVQRILDTLVGIVVALLVNLLLPGRGAAERSSPGATNLSSSVGGKAAEMLGVITVGDDSDTNATEVTAHEQEPVVVVSEESSVGAFEDAADVGDAECEVGDVGEDFKDKI